MNASCADPLDVSPSADRDASLVDDRRRLCDWCGGAIPEGARRDAVTCKQACRQARHRFRSGRAVRPIAAGPMRLGYADPPYLKCCTLYGHFHPDGRCWDDLDTHRRLIERLSSDFPAGWALSLSAASLRAILPLCPDDVRVASWHRGERPTRAFGPLNAWEPVVFRGGRAIEPSSGSPRRLDVLEYVSRPRLTDPNRVIGAKPAAFCYWLFDLLGALPGDDFVDLFAGSGGVARAWRYYASSSGPERHVVEDLRDVSLLQRADASCSPADATRRVSPAHDDRSEVDQ